VVNGEKSEKVSWKVGSDIYNNTFIHCEKSKSYAWFKTLGDTFYFTYFKGNKDSLLFLFYLSSFKIIHTYYPKMMVTDNFPLNIYPGKFLLTLQDFCLPFYRFLSAGYKMNYESLSGNSNKQVQLKSKARFGKNGTIMNSIYLFQTKVSRRLKSTQIQKNLK